MHIQLLFPIVSVPICFSGAGHLRPYGLCVRIPESTIDLLQVDHDGEAKVGPGDGGVPLASRGVLAVVEPEVERVAVAVAGRCCLRKVPKEGREDASYNELWDSESGSQTVSGHSKICALHSVPKTQFEYVKNDR